MKSSQIIFKKSHLRCLEFYIETKINFLKKNFSELLNKVYIKAKDFCFIHKIDLQNIRRIWSYVITKIIWHTLSGNTFYSGSVISKENPTNYIWLNFYVAFHHSKRHNRSGLACNQSIMNKFNLIYAFKYTF